MAHFEKRLSSETKFEGRVITVTLDRVELENGGTSTREVVRHHGGAGVAALNDEGELYLVRQYRYPMGEETLELPAGKLEPGEDPRDSGLRELAEETGLVPGTFEDMGCLYSSPGILAERIYLYFAKNLTQGPTHPDDGEYALDLLMIAKYFERIGDHATNIAEWVIFSVTGVHKEG